MTVRFRSYLMAGLFLVGLAARVLAAEILSGEELYYVCAACHGEKGEGVEARRAPKISGLENGYLLRQMQNYKAEIRGAHPQDIYGLQMILYARTLQVDDIERLVTYIVSLPDMPAAATIKGDIGRGGKIYNTCATCHGQRGDGKKDFGAPRLAGMNDWYLASQLRNFRAGIIGHSDKDGFRKPHAATIKYLLTDDASITDVVAYINSLGKPNPAEFTNMRRSLQDSAVPWARHPDL